MVIGKDKGLKGVVQLDSLGQHDGSAWTQIAAPHDEVLQGDVLPQQQLRHVVGRLGAHPVAREVERVHGGVVHEGLCNGT